MSLWDVLSVIAGSAAFGGSLGAVLVLRGGRPSLLVGALLGLVLGALATYLVRALGNRIGPTASWLRLLYGVAFLWIFIAAYLANRMTRFVLMELVRSP